MPANKSAFAALETEKQGGGSRLGLVVNGKTVEPGQYFPRAEAQTAPELSFPGAKGTYLVVALDVDAPFVMAPFLGPILHWIQSDITADPATGALKVTTTPVCSFIGPAPPPGSTHRYCFFLYEQPDGFDAKQYPQPSMMGRMFTSLDDFEKKAGLGKIVACNHFTSS